MSQNTGINLIFQNITFTKEDVRDLMLHFMPHGPLYEGFRIPGKNKYIIFDTYVQQEFEACSALVSMLKNLNYMEANEEGLAQWEEICSLDKKNFTVFQRRINVAMHIGLTKNIITIQDLAFFISNTLGLSYIKWRYASGELTNDAGYNYKFDATRDYGGYGRRQGIIWTLNKSLTQNNKDLKYFLDKIRIQTQVNFYEDENGKELQIIY